MLLNAEDLADAMRAFSALIGLPLSDMWRPIYQKFEFGEQKPHLNHKGQETAWADWGLIAACEWRIEGPNDFVLSREDFKPKRRDDHALPFYDSLDSSPPIVESVDVLLNGALRLQMSGGYSLALDPDPPCEDQVEDWRLTQPADDPRGDLMFGPDGLEWSGITP